MLTEERIQYTYIRHRLFLTAMAIHLSLRVAPPDLQQGGNSRIVSPLTEEIEARGIDRAEQKHQCVWST
nr:ccmC [Zea mays]